MVSTVYTACADLAKPTYYLTTSSCRTIRRLRLSDELSQAGEILSYPISREEIILDL